MGSNVTRVHRTLIQLGLVLALLLSFGAVSFDPGLDGDGDENIGVSIVMPTRYTRQDARIKREKAAGTSAPDASVTPEPSFHSIVAIAPMPSLGSPQLIIPLRT
jgi:hypothetical protein